MEMDFMGLNSKEEAIEAGGLENLNNHQLDENQKNIDPHGSAQLTIFYKGTVNIFDNMSPEKAHAIMLLAGNGAKAHAQAQVYADTPRTTTIGQPMNMTLSSPLSLGASITRDAPKKMNSFRRVMQSGLANGLIWAMFTFNSTKELKALKYYYDNNIISVIITNTKRVSLAFDI
ncbi:hypothetical protein R6Q59_002780 [Mikania micrantha]